MPPCRYAAGLPSAVIARDAAAHAFAYAMPRDVVVTRRQRAMMLIRV